MPQNGSANNNDDDTCTCLIVEDSRFDQERIKRIIRTNFKDVYVAVAGNLKEARQHMMKYQTSFILLDNSLPDGLGSNFAMELRENPLFKHIPIVIVSDWPTPFMFDKAQSAGVIHVVSKSDFDARYIGALLNRPVAQQRTG